MFGDDDQPIDINLEPDDDVDDGLSGLSDFDDEFNNLSQNDTFNDTDDDDEDLDDAPAEDTDGSVHRFRDLLKSWLSPKMRMKIANFKLKKKVINAKIKNSKVNGKTKVKLQHDALKAKAKQLGKLSLALLALKLMMDHHSDEVTKMDNKELLELSKQSKSKAKKGKKQNMMLLSLGHLNKQEINKGLNKLQGSINAGQGVANGVKQLVSEGQQDLNSVNSTSLNNLKSGTTSWLDKLAMDMGFNPTKIHNSFNSMISTLKSWF